MIAIDLNDECLYENLKLMRILKNCGYSDEEIQSLYERSLKIQREKQNTILE